MRKLYAKTLSSERKKQLLTKPAFDEVVLSKNLQASIEKTFGKPLSAQEVTAKIVQEVRFGKDEALFKWTKLLDGVQLTAQTCQVTENEFIAAQKAVEPDVWSSIKAAIANVRKFHTEQLPKTWLTYRKNGAMLGQNCLPLACVGIYVPGGTASYPSSVIMNAVPAKVAGVKDVIMAVPPNAKGEINPYVLATARACGVDKVFKMGGAQAIAALAFGTETVPKVDKITGPGNIFVTLAKKEVYGHCDIDMLAGPSEILVVADETAKANVVAADLLSQAEHDVLASSILITTSEELAKKVETEITRQLALLERSQIAAAAIERNGLMMITDTIKEAIELANICAPEHMELMTKEPFSLLPFVRNAGAVFLGAYSPEPLGDYFAGPNHILPTGGTARFYSVLNVETFMKKSSIIAYSQEALENVSQDIVRLARAEGLGAHARAILIRGDQNE